MEQTYPTRATVEPGGHRSLAWCTSCQDGLRGSLPKAEAWAAEHNKDRHPAEPTLAETEAPC
jgi:hypothetical protein